MVESLDDMVASFMVCIELVAFVVHPYGREDVTVP